MKKSIVFICCVLLGAPAFASEIESQKVLVEAGQIKERFAFPKQGKNQNILVQVIQEETNIASDLSNTGRIVLSVSVFGEGWNSIASFVISGSMGLKSSRKVADGLYEIVYTDADAWPSNLEVTKLIDAKKAMADVENDSCEEFGICQVKTTLTADP
jgi:hypothetical protein